MTGNVGKKKGESIWAARDSSKTGGGMGLKRRLGQANYLWYTPGDEKRDERGRGGGKRIRKEFHVENGGKRPVS